MPPADAIAKKPMAGTEVASSATPSVRKRTDLSDCRGTFALIDPACDSGASSDLRKLAAIAAWLLVVATAASVGWSFCAPTSITERLRPAPCSE